MIIIVLYTLKSFSHQHIGVVTGKECMNEWAKLLGHTIEMVVIFYAGYVIGINDKPKKGGRV
jgi:hypothetical protein